MSSNDTCKRLHFFSILAMKGYLDFRYGIYSETIPLLILSAFLSYSLRMERLYSWVFLHSMKDS